MKLFTKICLILSLMCACIGAVSLCAGIALGSGVEEVMAMADAGDLDIGNWHIAKWNFYYNPFEDDTAYTKIQKGMIEESFAADEITELEIDIKYGEVLFTDSDTDDITITVDAPTRNVYVYNVKGGTLEFMDETPGRYWKQGAKRDVEITIGIPKGKSFESVDLTTDYGMIDVEHVIFAEDVEIGLGAGEVQARKLTAGSDFSVEVGAGNLMIEQFDARALEIDCGIGKAELYGTVLEDVDAKCGIGQIVLGLKGKEEDYDYMVNCDLGTTSINDKEYSALSEHREIDNDAGREISLDCGIGKIELMVEEEL